MNLHFSSDLWQYLSTCEKPIVMYGMGNGADKILSALAERGIEISDFFASDGFVRGHSFHGKTVLSYSAVKEKYGVGNFIVLLSFATSLPDVIERIEAIASECELYVPDVPVTYSENAEAAELFDLSYFTSHRTELEALDALLADERSRELLSDVISYRITGKLPYLSAVDTREDVYTHLLHPISYRCTADLGAYNGDTVRELLPYAPNLERVFCMEPDPRNFRKLSEYAAVETRTTVVPLNFAAHDRRETLIFESSGNRNATLSGGNPACKKHRAVEADSLTHLLSEAEASENTVRRIDYIKFDVEGAERSAIDGCLPIIRRDKPELLVSLYHRREDLFALPLYLASVLEDYDFYLRRFRYIPAWDLNLYAIPKRK